MQRLEEMGYEVLSSGWPDLLVAKDGRLHCVVELKSFRDDLRPNQLRVHESLRSAGVIVHLVYEQHLTDFMGGMQALKPDETWAAKRERERIDTEIEKVGPSLRDGVMRQQSRARGEWLKAKQRRAPEKACKPGSVPRAVSRPG